MKAMLPRIVEAHESADGALFATIDAHAAAFAGDVEEMKVKIREAIGMHRHAINLLVSALPDRLEMEGRK